MCEDEEIDINWRITIKQRVNKEAALLTPILTWPIFTVG